jgi:hypothetical protein
MGRLYHKPNSTVSTQPTCTTGSQPTVVAAAHSTSRCRLHSRAASRAARGCGRVTLGGGLGMLGKGSSGTPVQGRGGTEDGVTGGGAGSAGRESRIIGTGKKRRRSD